jgi:RNA recognition motif-containing protein
MKTLFLVNVPHNCTEAELTVWAELHGVKVKSVRLVRDLVAGVSPSFAYLEIRDRSSIADALNKLNGQSIHQCTISVYEARRGATAA